MDKRHLLIHFRDKAADYYEDVETSTQTYKDKAAILNRKIVQFREGYIREIVSKINDDTSKLERVLLITYVSYIVMLEYRNKVWAYDYMAFSRRIGELWEPFCKLPFEYPIKELSIYLLSNDLIKYLTW